MPRLLLLTEMFGGMLFLVWLIGSLSRSSRASPEAEHLHKTVKAAAWVALVVAAAAFIVNSVGYVTLANLVGKCAP